MKLHTDVSFAGIDEFPNEKDYGKTILRIFTYEFDGIVLENSSGSGNYAVQLYLSSDSVKYRRRQGSIAWGDWQPL